MSDHLFLDPPKFHSMDSMPIRMTSLDLLDMAQVAAHISRAAGLGRYSGPEDPVEYLLQKQCAVRVDTMIHPTLAGILCFGHDPQTTIPNAVVDLGHYQGLQPLTYEVLHLDKNIGGSIFSQLQRVEEYLWRNTHHGMTVGEHGLERIDVHEYPRVVVRELLVNLLAHRDYMMRGAAARVLLFRDRIEWHSPGGLPPGVTVDNLLKAQTSRNPVLLSVLHEAGYVEAYGQGLDTVVTVLRDEQMRLPEFEDIGAAFMVTVYGRAPEDIQNITVTSRLTASQRRIVTYLTTYGDAALRDIRDLFDDRTDRTIQRDLESLVSMRLIEPVGEGRGRRYRLVQS